ncbi:MAG: hypothetical protein KDK11_20290, partial [Maritimibacter sp.]|nr:hypothetical protein [Maritimibacter sp.]
EVCRRQSTPGPEPAGLGERRRGRAGNTTRPDPEAEGNGQGWISPAAPEMSCGSAVFIFR